MTIQILMLIIAISLIIYFAYKNNIFDGAGNGIIVVVISSGLFFPCLFYYFNPKVRHFYVRMFWEEAPDCLQQCNPNRVVEIQVNRY